MSCVPVTSGKAGLPERERRKQPLRNAVKACLELYLRELDGHPASGIYQLVLAEVEPAVLETVMNHAGGNQTRAAEMLGINRATLRKKLRHYGIEY